MVELTLVTSSDSSSVSGGRMDGTRRASMVFPEPGGPTKSLLCTVSETRVEVLPRLRKQ